MALFLCLDVELLLDAAYLYLLPLCQSFVIAVGDRENLPSAQGPSVPTFFQKKKELSSTIIALLQWCYYHAIKLCNSRLQEIDLIIIWQICQERKIRPGKFLCHRLRFKASVHTSERLLELRWCKIFNTDFFKCTLTQDLNPTDSSLFDPVGSVWLSEAYKLVQIQI